VAIPNGALTNEIAKASIAAPAECGRLTLSIMENITVKPSPTWIQQRLSGAGMRPISNVVDASNYVMLELGQPNHPYDASKVVGKSLGVRHAVAGETIKTLDGVVRELAKPGRGLGDSGVDVVIVDGNDTILGLAGVMGGDASGVSESTTEVLFEAAFFDPMTIARSSKRHGLRSEASARFERGVDPELAIRSTARFVEILKQSCPEIIWRSEPLDVRGQLPRVPNWAEPGGLSKAQRLRRHLRDVVVDFGAAEAWTPTLGSDADFELLDSGERVRVTNPLASEESVLRNTLVTGLVRAWARNVERGTGDLILSELGNVFIHPKAAASPRSTKGGVAGSVTLQLPEERERLGVLLGRPEDDAKTAVAFATGIFNRLGLADVVLRSPEQVPMGFHPTRVAEAVDRQSQSVLGYVGEVSPLLLAALETPEDRRVGLVDLDFEAIADESRAIRLATEAKIPSKFPSALVDLAFVAPDSLHADDLRCALQRAAQ
jgi:phenylalanyl-tRNA synthetase beta subunit